tara:strand:- start:2465 stop:2806 length:342 start_codon:yes stop_codon:yes gene_type:complete
MITRDDGWHLDKKVPLGLIGAVLLQSFIFGVWAATLQSSGEANTKGLADLSGTVAQDKVFHTDQRIRIWDRVDKVEDKIQSNETNIAKAVAGIEHLTKQVDLLVVHMIDNANK